MKTKQQFELNGFINLQDNDKFIEYCNNETGYSVKFDLERKEASFFRNGEETDRLPKILAALIVNQSIELGWIERNVEARENKVIN